MIFHFDIKFVRYFVFQSTFKMEQPIDHLKEIRSLMEKSARFISLSGLSGVSAGLCALIGGSIAWLYWKKLIEIPLMTAFEKPVLAFFVLDLFLILVCAIGSAAYFTLKRANKQGQSIWDPSAKRLLFHFSLPLACGGMFCLLLIFHQISGLIAPSMLIFYGLGLVSASKFTFEDIKWLGLAEIVLGMLNLVFIGYGFFFWMAGFGLLHILYGLLMFNKYER